MITSRARNDMRSLVLGVLVGARERWEALSLQDKQALVRHMRAIANGIEVAAAKGERP